MNGYYQSFIDKFANGINPIDGSMIPGGDVVNNARISKCFSYVSSLLEQMIDEKSRINQNEEKMGKRVRFNPFAVPLAKFRFSDEPISMAEMHKRLDELVDRRKMRNIARSRIPVWLVNIGLLTLPTTSDRRYYGHPTEAGLRVGISTLLYVNEYGEHRTLSFTREAQQFIIDNLGQIIQASARDRKPQN